uniref:Uncharacterized protein n=1 Tax=Desertifilum tharense IPPAS B-1220 TaxID=1781255 RepID=A0ACD5GX26_9CYAN
MGIFHRWGATWQEFGAISPTEATVLRDTPNDRIRFLPNLNFIGSADILFQAWDATDGNPSGTQNIDASLAGGTTAFSLASDTYRHFCCPTHLYCRYQRGFPRCQCHSPYRFGGDGFD